VKSCKLKARTLSISSRKTETPRRCEGFKSNVSSNHMVFMLLVEHGFEAGDALNVEFHAFQFFLQAVDVLVVFQVFLSITGFMRIGQVLFPFFDLFPVAVTFFMGLRQEGLEGSHLPAVGYVESFHCSEILNSFIVVLKGDATTKSTKAIATKTTRLLCLNISVLCEEFFFVFFVVSCLLFEVSLCS